MESKKAVQHKSLLDLEFERAMRRLMTQRHDHDPCHDHVVDAIPGRTVGTKYSKTWTRMDNVRRSPSCSVQSRPAFEDRSKKQSKIVVIQEFGCDQTAEKTCKMYVNTERMKTNNAELENIMFPGRGYGSLLSSLRS